MFDTMRHIRPDVSTVCVGLAASMGAFLLASGHKARLAHGDAGIPAVHADRLRHVVMKQPSDPQKPSERTCECVAVTCSD